MVDFHQTDRQHGRIVRRSAEASAISDETAEATSAQRSVTQAYRQARERPAALPPGAVLALQRTIGNAAVSRLLRRPRQPASAVAAEPEPAAAEAGSELAIPLMATGAPLPPGLLVAARLGVARPPARVARVAGRPMIQRTKLDTMGGTFEDLEYDKHPEYGGTKRGVRIRLEFNPKDPVNATKIGFSQAVKGYKNNAPYAANNSKTLQDRTVAPGQVGEGYRTDRLKDAGNPIYATDDAANLASSAIPAGRAQGTDQSGNLVTINQFGHHYRDLAKTLHHETAKMRDSPAYTQATTDSGMIFETTALALDGVQAGTYYGSVRWGWTTDSGGAFTQLPLEVVSYGVPSANFVEAAKKWNVTKTSAGADPLQLPTTFLPITFTVNYRTRPGQTVCVVGSAPELGAWNSDHAVPLRFVNENQWSGEVSLNANQAGQQLSYKYVLKEGTTTRWEEGANHRRTLPAAGTASTFNDTWHEANMGW